VLRPITDPVPIIAVATRSTPEESVFVTVSRLCLGEAKKLLKIAEANYWGPNEPPDKEIDKLEAEQDYLDLHEFDASNDMP
jgi:hypothetical protein